MPTFSPIITVEQDNAGPGIRVNTSISEEAAILGTTVTLKVDVLKEGAIGGGTTNPPTTSSTSLDTYSGAWNLDTAARLMRRVTYAPTYAEISQVKDDNLLSSLDRLKQEAVPDAGPYYHRQNESGKPSITVGQSWRGKYDTDGYSASYRTDSMKNWYWRGVLEGGRGPLYRMRAFWENHFGVNEDGYTTIKEKDRYIQVIERNVLGNFRQMVKEMTINPAMLRRLNGYLNDKREPDENYAREVMELFVLGLGPNVGGGDYTTYTEDDVATLARAFTGMRLNIHGERPELPLGDYFFNPDQHDTDPKTFSHRFGGATLQPNGENEYKDAIDLLFEQPSARTFIVEQLYIWFVSTNINDTVRQNVIKPLGDKLYNDDYEIWPTLRTLLASKHFFEQTTSEALYKDPIDYVASVLRPVGSFVSASSDDDKIKQVRLVNDTVATLGMSFNGPEAIAGWDAFRKLPWGEQWNSGQQLADKDAFASLFFNRGTFNQGVAWNMNYLDWAESLPNPRDINAVLDTLELVYFPSDRIGPNERQGLKEAALDQLPDGEWTIQMDQYLDPAQHDGIKSSMEKQIAKLLIQVAGSPYFQLS